MQDAPNLHAQVYGSTVQLSITHILFSHGLMQYVQILQGEDWGNTLQRWPRCEDRSRVRWGGVSKIDSLR